MDKAKLFKKIMEESNSSRVVILTAHYQIMGNVYDCEDCNKDSCINLTAARVCNVTDSYEGICENESYFDWLHVNMDSITAYSFIK